jgi:hypothetical protein
MIRIAFLPAVLCGQIPQNQSFGLHNVEFVVKLLSPINTSTARAGDAFTASVDTPSEYRGAAIEGRITKLRKAKRAGGKAEVQFQFETLTYNSRTGRISAELHSVVNSKGMKNVDEEGRIIGKTSKKKRIGATVGGAALGGIIGAVAGGASGAAIGAAAGAAGGLMVGVTMTTSGSNIEFGPGSIFTLRVSDASNRR